MPFSVVLVTVVLLLSNIDLAAAADPIQLAETGAFLLGNAYRCGVPVERVSHAAQIVQDLTVAASRGASEEKAAASRFAEIFVKSAYPDQTGQELIPPCKVVVTQFERLEQHHQQAGLN